jgi:hypothetical protein
MWSICQAIKVNTMATTSYVHSGHYSREEAINGVGTNNQVIVPMETEEGVPPRAPKISDSSSN